jgi:hypothetical protein
MRSGSRPKAERPAVPAWLGTAGSSPAGRRGAARAARSAFRVPRSGTGPSHRVCRSDVPGRQADLNGDGRISREEFFDLLKESHAPDRWAG